MANNNINDLCPELQVIYREWIAQCHAANLAVKVIQTWRSPIDQDTAKAQGLSNASAGQSPHNCCNPDGSPGSKAFDWACFDENAQYITEGTDSRYTQSAQIGKSLGLVWGGDWENFKDYDHLEMANWNTEQAEPVNT